ncbi:YqaE/Pmp3 family membrane protein [Leeuwenhoekiella sp. A16]|uniref:YqaE/Pmp3 family membrane protein n=1 Tax=unclassified Leeuwenhoekiella TaxID=2615029 RepID=UPI003A80BB77|tara:strand:- start:940 stop:1095 length:156 start_codon:yes stop_codon:yes gene_type:complete
MSILTIILSILLPPVAVALKHGISGALFINILLTLLGWLPGVVHAFYVNSK